MSDELFEAVRSAATSAAWSRGVELARAGAVSVEREDGDEIALRVATRGGLISPAVTLLPGLPSWDCDCGTLEEVCEHVAAAVIALRRAQREGGAPAAPARGHIGYRFEREGDGLSLERVVVRDGAEEILTSTLVAVASGRVEGPAFAATRADLAVEQVLGAKRRGRVPRGVLTALLAPLSQCADVKLGALALHASPEPLGWKAVVEDDGPAFRLRIEREADVAALFDDAVALCGDTLRPLAPAQLSGREREDFGGRGRRFDPDQAPQLATEILPSLAARMPLEVRTQRLPRAVRETPRLVLEVTRQDDGLAVLPLLVYGEPALARIDAGRLVPLGDGPVPVRDEEAERALVSRLSSRLGLTPGHRIRVAGADAVELAEGLRAFEPSVRGSAHREFFRAPPLEPHLRVAGDDFELAFTSAAPGGARRADPARVLRAWREGEALVPLEGGGFAPLPADWLARYGPVLADLLAARAAAGRLPRAALPALAELCGALGEPAPPSFEGLRGLLEAGGELPAAPLPADLRAELRGYQRRGVDWLCALRDAGLGALLADDMGLGKTLQALCALRGRSLVVAPTSVLHNWALEIERFRPALRCRVYHGSGRELEADADVTLTTYALLRLDSERLLGEAWDTVVLDEAQAIKNPDSQAAAAAHSLRAGWRLALTGTPIENRLTELWSLFQFASPGLLGARRDFEERYARPVAAGDAEAAQRLRARIRPFVLRRVKREVAPELPARTDVVLEVELDAEERRLYEAVQAATREDVVRRLGAGGSVVAALEALLRLRQAACHRALLPGQRAETSSKLLLLLDRVGEVVAEGNKALVFSQWTSLLDLIEPHLERAGIPAVRLDGSTRDRAGVVAAFQDPAGPPLLLASLTAGGVGLNLTAADCVFLMDPWWNPAVEEQAAGRAHRIGRERPVLVYRLVARETVEERILALQGRKRELFEAALGGTGVAAGLTREDLLELLG